MNPNGVLRVYRRVFILLNTNVNGGLREIREGVVDKIHSPAWAFMPDACNDIRRDQTHLPSSIDDMTIILDALVNHTLRKGRLDCRVV